MNFPKFTTDIQMPKRPPLGIIPFKIWHEQRIADIEAAIIRYAIADKPIPKDWINELEIINSFLLPKSNESFMTEEERQKIIKNFSQCR